jgi:hypothetical protein
VQELFPPRGLAFVWNTIRKQAMVTVGTSTPDNQLQTTRSKKSLQ